MVRGILTQDQGIISMSCGTRHEDCSTYIDANHRSFLHRLTVKENLELITFPSHWATRWTQGTKTNNGISKRYARYFDKPIQIKPNVFNKELKIIHFTHSLNKPHESNIFAHLYN